MNSPDATPAANKRVRPVRKVWHWHPDLPLRNARIFTWPPNPLLAIKLIASYWLSLSGRVVILLVAIASWLLFQSSLGAAVDFEFGWIAHIYLRNLTLLVVFATGLHLYFHTYQAQGTERRFDSRAMVRDNPVFTFRSQLYDNIFWSLVSGLTVWTAYEVLFMWAYANQYVPTLAWSDNPDLRMPT